LYLMLISEYRTLLFESELLFSLVENGLNCICLIPEKRRKPILFP